MSGIEIKPDGAIGGAFAPKPVGGKAPTVPITLAPKGWPIVHGTVQSKDNSDYSGPVTAAGPFTFATSQTINEKPDNTGVAQMLLTSMLGASKNGGLRSMADQASVLLGFSLADSNPVSVITDKRPDGSTLLWTSTIRNVIVYKVSPEAPGTLQEVAKYDHGYNFRFHGSYAFVGEVNGQSHFFTTDNDSLVSYTLVEEGGRKGGYSIKPLGKLALPVWTNPSGADHLVGVTVLDDGTVVVCSKTGVLMASRADGKGGFVLMDTLALGDFTRTSNNEVSNSISADGQGIFIVTQREVCRVDFNPATGRLGFKWSTIYGPEAPWYIGRLGPGAGSTPSISECGGRKTIVITDGAMPMNVLWYDAEKGVLAGSRKVQFTEDENGNLPTQSEQSVAVDGCKAFVVQNYMGMTELDDSVFCTTAPQGGFVREQIPQICDQLLPYNSTDLFLSRACPPALGCYSPGMAVYEMDPHAMESNGQNKVSRAWTRMDKSCGTSIPLISKGSNAAYCVGAEAGSSQWTLLGMDMDTGKDVFSHQFYEEFGARNIFINPFYAGVEAIGDNEIVIGSVGGIVYVSPMPAGGTTTTTKFRSLSADFQKDMSRGVTSMLHGNLHDVTMPVGATLIAAGLAVLALLFVVLRRGHALVSPRLPTRT
ncbi:hypothetical protein NSK_007591 [Nannochloropsis salina CCMP1776]|uniref:Uncharacterized protein n=1 Tax=Nannochloropsis salina CCMP1776 TaxID=1027361 RepID=A0A4D9CWJ3_9STRA|nr:hypothetical protein NSK_007591 [Nannochloropsis salina CCMP1776]|eukprot:TFJ80948.1 hypothetical protein NSK_007591 [Nannochloropsis salina CCMP1776]